MLKPGGTTIGWRRLCAAMFFLSLVGLLLQIRPRLFVTKQQLKTQKKQIVTFEELLEETDQAIDRRRKKYVDLMTTADVTGMITIKRIGRNKDKKNRTTAVAIHQARPPQPIQLVDDMTIQSDTINGGELDVLPTTIRLETEDEKEEGAKRLSLKEITSDQPEREHINARTRIRAINKTDDSTRVGNSTTSAFVTSKRAIRSPGMKTRKHQQTSKRNHATAPEEGESMVVKSRLVCFSWLNNTDQWWQDHPTWEVQHENITHTCFSAMMGRNPTKSDFFQRIYENQFHNTNCSNLRTRFVLGTGFAATISYLLDGFWSAYREDRPFQRSKHRADFRWMYSPIYNNESNSSTNSPIGSCPSQDTSCYFLPLSCCQNYTVGKEDVPWKKYYKGEIKSDPMRRQEYVWLSQYLMRPQHVVRQQLAQLRQQQQQLSIDDDEDQDDCTVLHVRRTDATSEKRYPRNFYPLSQYLTRGNVTENSTIVLLTDDETTLEEANYLHPNYNWVYIKRQRHRGNVPMNSHFPSGDASLEVMLILLELQLASRCTKLVHGTSNMVKLISQSMQLKHGMDEVQLVTIGDEEINFHIDAPIPPEVFLKELGAKIRQAKLKRLNTKEAAVAAAQTNDGDASLVLDKNGDPLTTIKKQVIVNGTSYSMQQILGDVDKRAKNGTTRPWPQPRSLVFPLPKPIIVVGLPKAGTSTIWKFFEQAGYNTSHWLIDPKKGNDIPSNLIGNCMREAIVNLSLPPLQHCGHFDVWAQTDVAATPDQCVFPQISFLEEIHQEEPHATFVLNRRELDAWASSVQRWNPEKWNATLAERLVQCHPLGVGPKSPSISSLVDWNVQHVARIRNFVKDHPSHALVEIDIQDPQTGNYMAHIFQTSPDYWGHANHNDKNSVGHAANHNNNKTGHANHNNSTQRTSPENWGHKTVHANHNNTDTVIA